MSHLSFSPDEFLELLEHANGTDVVFFNSPRFGRKKQIMWWRWNSYIKHFPEGDMFSQGTMLHHKSLNGNIKDSSLEKFIFHQG